MWNLVQETITAIDLIKDAAIVHHPVGNCKIGNFKCDVVMPNLIECVLSKLNRRPFTFHNHYGLNLPVVDDNIRPIVTILYWYGYLNAN